MAAKVLSEQGLRVAVLEAGPALDARTIYGSGYRHMAKRLYRLRVNGRQARQCLHAAYWEANPDLFVDDREHPYTTPRDQPFAWIRGRQVGGRSLTWGGLTIRMSDHEFKAASVDGYGQDWPIGHEDLAPHYDAIERFLAVKGARDRLPQLPDGNYAAALPLTPGERHLGETITNEWSDRSLVAARGIDASRNHAWTPETPWPMHSSIATSLKAALATGRTDLVSDAVVSHVVLDRGSGRASGVVYVDRHDRSPREIRGRIVVLCASTIETVRILLHSTEDYQPGGLIDESGSLGHYVMDHVTTATAIHFPVLPAPDEQSRLVGCGGFLVPKHLSMNGGHRHDFLRGYGFWGGIQRGQQPPKSLRKIDDGSTGFMVAQGEMLPRYENHIRLSPDITDAFGLPAPHIECSWGENDRRMLKDMRAELEAIIHYAGGRMCGVADLMHLPLVSKHVRTMERQMTDSVPGLYVHEVGGARMGTSPATSVVDPLNRCWNTPNLLVTDGACWVSNGWQNPTLTQMAITSRACHAIVEALKRNEV
jgi:choline dehydrogenase-like flavoprotein